MSKIYEFELKAVKNIGINGVSANLYYKNKKILTYVDEGSINVPKLEIKDNLDEILLNDVYITIKKYYERFPKEFLISNDDSLLIEFIEELYRLKELENIFKKANKKNPKKLLLLKFAHRDKCVTDYKKDDICIITNILDEEFKSKLKEKYNYVECSVYNTIEDFIIELPPNIIVN